MRIIMKKDKTNLIGVIVAIIVLILIVLLSNLNTDKISVVENVASKVFMPMQNGFIFIKEKMSGNGQELNDMASLKKENDDLKQENEKLQESLRELEILKSENNTLKDYLNLKNKYSEYTTIPANVIERSYSNYDKIVIINAGSNDGLTVNMPVISEYGLVGHIISLTENTAKVQTIIDTASTVSATISTATNTILLKGQLNDNSKLKATYIPTESTVLQGDDVVTSGMGGIYPKGILIGTVNDIINTKNESDRYATISTATDFEKLETVLVIIGK